MTFRDRQKRPTVAAPGTVPGSESDYLDADLRMRVEQLKRASSSPTRDLDELGQRLNTLWQWGNAYAMTGGPIPVDFPTTVSRSLPVVRPSESRSAKTGIAGGHQCRHQIGWSENLKSRRIPLPWDR